MCIYDNCLGGYVHIKYATESPKTGASNKLYITCRYAGQLFKFKHNMSRGSFSWHILPTYIVVPWSVGAVTADSGREFHRLTTLWVTNACLDRSLGDGFNSFREWPLVLWLLTFTFTKQTSLAPYSCLLCTSPSPGGGDKGSCHGYHNHVSLSSYVATGRK